MSNDNSLNEVLLNGLIILTPAAIIAVLCTYFRNQYQLDDELFYPEDFTNEDNED